MKFISIGVLVYALTSPHVQATPQSPQIKMLRSLSGPSGKVAGSKFVFDSLRNRFVFPQDKTLVVYFEFEVPPGDHTLTAIWKAPDGHPAFISPDVKMETQTTELNAYWTYQIEPQMPTGIWSVEVRIDGQPIGVHSFELVLPEHAKEAQPALASEPQPPTLDEMFHVVGRSPVWVHKLDATGRRSDTSSGFVIAPNRVATAFQVIDASVRLEVEFPDGRKVNTDEIVACDRLQDWAVISVTTTAIANIAKGDMKTLAIGERAIVFNVETGLTRAIGGVDITGQRDVPGFGPRIQISPSPSPEAVGGPLLNTFGKVVGIVGGSVVPGSHFNSREMAVSPALWSRLDTRNAATPITLVNDAAADPPTTLKALFDKGTLTAPIAPMPNFLYGGTTNNMPKEAGAPSPRDFSEFSRHDAQVFVYSMWEKKDKNGKGSMSGQVYDARNRMWIEVKPKKLSLPERAPLRTAFGFSPSNLEPGVYRVDILWDGLPVWRTFFTVVD